MSALERASRHSWTDRFQGSGVQEGFQTPYLKSHQYILASRPVKCATFHVLLRPRRKNSPKPAQLTAPGRRFPLHFTDFPRAARAISLRPVRTARGCPPSSRLKQPRPPRGRNGRWFRSIYLLQRADGCIRESPAVSLPNRSCRSSPDRVFARQIFSTAFLQKSYFIRAKRDLFVLSTIVKIAF